MTDIEDLLTKLGFDLRNESSSFWRAIPVYRESSNASSLRISKEYGSFIDFAANIKGSLYELVQLSLGLKTLKEAKEWVKVEGYSPSLVEKKPKIKLDKKIDMKYVNGLMPHFSFYEKRGISPETLNNFECGVCFSGKQNNRLVFVIRNEDGDVVGVVGRDLIGGRVKWKKLGDSRKWVFPLASVDNAQAKEEVFLVESIGDMLALYEIGVKNVMVLFGIDLSPKVLNILSTLNLKKIYISTNNDKEKEKNWGALAAEGIKQKLSKVIDENIIKICLPPNGDWGDLDETQRKKYVEEIRTN